MIGRGLGCVLCFPCVFEGVFLFGSLFCDGKGIVAQPSGTVEQGTGFQCPKIHVTGGRGKVCCFRGGGRSFLSFSLEKFSENPGQWVVFKKWIHAPNIPSWIAFIVIVTFLIVLTPQCPTLRPLWGINQTKGNTL